MLAEKYYMSTDIKEEFLNFTHLTESHNLRLSDTLLEPLKFLSAEEISNFFKDV